MPKKHTRAHMNRKKSDDETRVDSSKVQSRPQTDNPPAPQERTQGDGGEGC